MIRLLAVDSDGCVMDSMTIKHTRCFTPALIEIWNLHAVAEQATKLALDINLYSETRGLNRFAALALFFEQLKARTTAEMPTLDLPDTVPLQAWLSQTKALSEQALAAAHAAAPAPILAQAIEWSQEVNRRIQELPPAEPFAEAVTTLREAHRLGIALHVVSSANRSALEMEWREVNLLDLVAHLGSQDEGSKTALLQQAAAAYGSGAVLMVGDARGDAEAAEAAGVAYYAIQPGNENASWQKLRLQFTTLLNK